jgi:WD40 repeat protein
MYQLIIITSLMAITLKKWLIGSLTVSILSQISGSSAHHVKAISPEKLRLNILVASSMIKETTCALQIDHQVPIATARTGGYPTLVFSPDSKTLAVTDYSGGSGLILLDLLSGKHENIMPKAWLGAISFSPDGKFLAIGSAGPSAFLMDREKKSLIKLEGHSRRIKDVQFSPDSQFVGTVGLDNIAKIWTLDGVSKVEIKGLSKSEFGTASDRNPQLSHLSWNSRGQMLTVASGKGGSQIIVWDSNNDKLVKLNKQSKLSHVQFTPDGSQIIAVSPDRTSLFTITGEEVSNWPSQKNISHLDFSSNGKFFVTTTSSEEKADRKASLWNIDGSLLTTLQGHREGITGAVISNDNQCIFTSSFDKTIRLWDVSGKELNQISGSFHISLSPDNSYLATVDEDNAIVIWKVRKIAKR